MRYKTVPPAPPDDLDGVAALDTVRDALPLVPRPEGDCCARLVDRVAWIDDRDAATEWIAFCHALGLAERSERGYARVSGEVDRDALVDRFRERVLGASEVLDAVAGTDLDPGAEETVTEPDEATVETAFAAVEPVIPEWERRRTDGWRADWRDHTQRLLRWSAMLEAAAAPEDTRDSP